MKTVSPAALIAAAVLLAVSASAAPQWTKGSWKSGFTPAENNLVRGMRGTLSGSQADARFTDGAATPHTASVPTIGNNAKLTFSFSEWKTLYEVRIYATWQDDGRDKITVSSITVDTATNATPVTLPSSSVSYDYNAASGSGEYANYAWYSDSEGTALVGAARSITINFGSQEAGLVGYPEIEIVGVTDADTPSLTITGDPAEHGQPSPDYGVYFSAPQRVSAPPLWTNATETICWHCTGWTLYRLNESHEWVFDPTLPHAQGSGLAFDFAPVEGINAYRLVWNWTPYYAVKVTVDAGGTASAGNDKFFPPGTTITLQAAPDDPGGYVIWSGDLPEGMAPNARSHTFTLTAPVALAAHFSDIIWVDDDAAVGGDGSAATPFQTIGDALAVVSAGGCITVKPGNYQLASETTLSTAITIQGETGDFNDVVIRAASGKRRAFTLSSAGPTLRCLTLRGTGGTANGVVYLQGGRLESCRITGGSCARQGGGAGVRNEGGTVRYCTIDGNTAAGNIFDGLGLYQSSGRTEYCIITNNKYSAWHGAYKHPCPAGAFVSGGTLRGTLIARNTPGTMNESLSDGYNGFALYLRNSPVIDGCAIVENTVKPIIGALPTAAVYSEGAATIINTIIVNNTDSNGDDLYLAGRKEASYSLLPSSVGVTGTGNLFEASGTYTWTDEGEFALQPLSLAVNRAHPLPDVVYSLDLYGRPRVNGDAMDLGPVECTTVAERAVVLHADAQSFHMPHTNDFYVTYSGFPAGGVSFAWTVDGEPVPAESSLTVAWTNCGMHAVSATVTSLADASVSLTDTLAIAALSRDIYLDASCPTPAYPYVSPETAATNYPDLATLIVTGGSLTARPGVYTVPSELSLSFPYEIRGVGKREDIIFTYKGSGRLLSASHPSVYIHGVTLRGGVGSGGTLRLTSGARAENVCLFGGSPDHNGSGGGCLYIANATIRDSAIGNTRTGENIGYGFGVRMQAGALVERCVITNVVATQMHYARDHAQGIGVHIAGGTLRNCLVAHNYALDGSTGTQGGNGRQYAIGVYQSGGSVENCTVVDNHSRIGPSGYYRLSGAITNTIVHGNVSVQDNGAADINIAGSAAEAMVNCHVDDPGFTLKGPKPHPYYSLSRSSPCVNAGAKLGWMDSSATDLSGARRIIGGLPDIGCYETPAPPGTVLFVQ